jgi:hypothetical protein
MGRTVMVHSLVKYWISYLLTAMSAMPLGSLRFLLDRCRKLGVKLVGI